MTTVQVATATIPVMIRRHNPYAKSFDGSLSASFDRNAPPASNYPTTCLECSHTSNTTPSRPIQASNLSHPRLSVSAPCTGGTPPSDGAFDVHSDSDDHEAPSAQLPALRGGNQAVASPYHNRVYNGITAPAASASLPLDAAALSAYLNAAGCPIDTPCPAGFVFTVYNGDISQHFNLHSETVQITRGSIKYVDHHARYGQQTRFRFQLCNNYLQHKCAKLSECSYIHATVLPKPSEVHLNPFAPRRLAADRHGHGHDVPMTAQDDPSVADAYETLPGGFTMSVYAPNAGSTGGPDANRAPQQVPTEHIIKTVGSETAFAILQAKAQGTADVRSVASRPRHCAHYQFKRLCNLGSQCHFIHSKVPFASAMGNEVPMQVAAANAHAHAHAHGAPRMLDRTPPAPRQTGISAYAAPFVPTATAPTAALPIPNMFMPPQQQPQSDPQAAALQQYLLSAAGAASDPNFLAGMQYAASLLAIQQQQQQIAQQQLAQQIARGGHGAASTLIFPPPNNGNGVPNFAAQRRQ